MRKNLRADFSSIYVLDLGGNVRKNPKLSGTTHNVFGIKVGVSINLLVRRKNSTGKPANIYHARLDEFWRKEQRYAFLDQTGLCRNISWAELHPDDRNNWITADLRTDFREMLPLASKESKATTQADPPVLFKLYSPGVLTARDEWVYGFDVEEVKRNVTQLARNYSLELARRQVQEQSKTVDDFVNRESTFIKWTDRLKDALDDGTKISFNMASARGALFRPFTAKFLYFDHLLNQRRYQQHRFFPVAEAENKLIWTKVPGEWSFFALATDRIPDYLPQGGSQCFPFYTYAEDGTRRRENITDWALEQFRSHYHDPSITKWDIFHYIYAVLHHPEYRERYAANLRRELPRIPFASVSSVVKDFDFFRELAKAGQRLAEIHVHYEQQPEYPLTKKEKAGEKLDWRVTRMRLSKDKTTLVYNNFLTLSEIPKETYDYRLGNRSALEWIIDQYQVSTDKRSGITNDPNREDDKQYVLRLIGQVITVSLETVTIARSLPPLGLGD